MKRPSSSPRSPRRRRFALGVACALALTSLIAHGSTYDRGPAGTMVLYALLSDIGYKVVRLFEARELTGSMRVAVAVGQISSERAKKLIAWAKRGRTLIIAPPLVAGDGLCGNLELADLEVKRKRSLSDIKSTTDKKLEVRSAVCLLDPPKTARVLLQSKDGKGALAFEHAVGEGRMLVLAHANLLTNRYLATDDVVVVLRRFVAKHAVVGDTIAFLEAARAGQMWRAMQRAGMLPLMGHALLWLLMIYWVFGPRFGETQRGEQARRREFSQHARALGSLYLGAQVSGYALRQQYERFRANVFGSEHGRGGAAAGGVRVAPVASAGAGGSEPDAASNAAHASRRRAALAALVATRSGRDVESVQSLLEQIESATAQDRPSDPKLVHRHYRLSQSLAELSHSAGRSGAPAKNKKGTGGR
ncbi:MAG: DUF4350 domain-containing protein [Myxococcales bacterium]|nr:DUF4350 domain-containing protein [Myxococcales bacterium]